MANLSNINNKFLVTTGGNVLIGQTSAVGSSIFQVTGDITTTGKVNAGDRILTEATTSNALLQVKYNSSNYLEGYYDKLNVVGGDFLIQRAGDTKIQLTSVGATFTNLSNTSAASSSADEVKIGTFGAGRPAIFLGTSNTTYTNSTWFIENIGAAGKLRIGRNGLDIVEIFNNGNTYFAGNVGIGTPSPDRSLDVRGTGMSIFGTGDYTELMLRGQVEGTGTVRSVGAWHWSIRADVGGDNDDLKLLRFNTGSYSGTAIQIRSDNGGVAIGQNNQGYSSQILSVKSGAADEVFYGESTDANCFASFRDGNSSANIEYGAVGNDHILRKDNANYFVVNNVGDVYNYQSVNKANTYYGYDAGNYGGTGGSNDAFGYEALSDVTTGTNNVAVGRGALHNLTVGAKNIAIGLNAGQGGDFGASVLIGYQAGSANTHSNNVGVGHEALFSCTNSFNTALGWNAGRSIGGGARNVAIGSASMENGGVSGDDNVGVGHYTFNALSTGNQNTAIGNYALDALTSGLNNVAVGYKALSATTTQSNNVAIGRTAMQVSSSANCVAIGIDTLEGATGNNNTAVGSFAGRAVTSGTENSLMGYAAGYNITSGSHNTCLGYDAFQAVTTTGFNTGVGSSVGVYQTGNYNTSMGYFSNYGVSGNSSGSYNTTNGYFAGAYNRGENNTFLGALAGRFNSTANRNTIVGSQAADNSTITGSDNTSLGFGSAHNIANAANNVYLGSNAGFLNGSSEGNVGIGYAALYNGQGGGNIAIGKSAMQNATSAASNIAIGYAAAGGAAMTGSGNVIMGDAAGYSITSGSNNILIGRNAGRSGSQTPQSMGAVITASNEIQIGNEGHTNAMVQVVWTINSDGRDKTEIKELDLGLEFVSKLKPVTYKWDKRSKYEDLTPDGTHIEDELQIGFIAQDIIELEKEYGYNIEDKTNLATWESEDKYKVGLKHSNLIPSLVKAIQELKAEIELLKSK